MSCAKEAVAILMTFGIDGRVDPYREAVHFYCMHSFPVDEIVEQIRLAIKMAKLSDMLPGGDTLTESEKKQALKLLREGKTVDEVFKLLRPGAVPNPGSP